MYCRCGNCTSEFPFFDSFGGKSSASALALSSPSLCLDSDRLIARMDRMPCGMSLTGSFVAQECWKTLRTRK
jgi:hypothetical protein